MNKVIPSYYRSCETRNKFIASNLGDYIGQPVLENLS